MRNDKVIFFIFFKFYKFLFFILSLQKKKMERVWLSFYRIKFSHRNRLCFKIYEKYFCNFKLLYFSSFFANFYRFKGTVKRAEPCKCDILVSSMIVWHKGITPIKEWRFWYLVLTSDFSPQFLLASLCSSILMKAPYFYRKKLVKSVKSQ